MHQKNNNSSSFESQYMPRTPAPIHGNNTNQKNNDSNPKMQRKGKEKSEPPRLEHTICPLTILCMLVIILPHHTLHTI